SVLRRREPDLPTGRRPGEALDRGVVSGNLPAFARSIDDHDFPAVISRARVMAKRDGIPFRGDTRMTDPPGRLVENLSSWQLQPRASPHVPDDRDLLAVRGPIGELHVLEDLAGGDAARDAGHCEPADSQERRDGTARE